MPMPPVLPVLNWKSIFESGKSYEHWLESAASTDHARGMEEACAALRLDPHIIGFLGALARPVHVVAIAEDWCGDVVRHVPVLQTLAEHAPQIEVRYIAREQHPEVFIRFLTNGGEAIPKFIFLNHQWTECGNWGPMPAACRELIARGKACGEVAAARRAVSALYEADPNRREVVGELLRLIDIAASEVP